LGTMAILKTRDGKGNVEKKPKKGKLALNGQPGERPKGKKGKGKIGQKTRGQKSEAPYRKIRRGIKKSQEGMSEKGPLNASWTNEEDE